jgi:hypothetical protein
LGVWGQKKGTLATPQTFKTQASPGRVRWPAPSAELSYMYPDEKTVSVRKLMFFNPEPRKQKKVSHKKTQHIRIKKPITWFRLSAVFTFGHPLKQ